VEIKFVDWIFEHFSIIFLILNDFRYIFNIMTLSEIMT